MFSSGVGQADVGVGKATAFRGMWQKKPRYEADVGVDNIVEGGAVKHAWCGNSDPGMRQKRPK